MNTFRTAALTLAATAGIAATALAPAGAQTYQRPYNGDRDNRPYNAAPYNNGPRDNHWQPGWDRGDYDRNHIMMGTVVKFSPFRLQLATQRGNVQTIDLKNGTIIRPIGTTPVQNERVAVEGYYSNGTFIANRIIIRG